MFNGLEEFVAAVVPNMFACSVCFGKTSSLAITSLNAAIISLLLILAVIFGLAIRFFVQFNRRAQLMDKN